MKRSDTESVLKVSSLSFISPTIRPSSGFNNYEIKEKESKEKEKSPTKGYKMTFDTDIIDEYNNRNSSRLNTSRSNANISNVIPILSDITKLRILRDKNKRANTFSANNIDINSKKYLKDIRLKSAIKINNKDKKDEHNDIDIILNDDKKLNLSTSTNTLDLLSLQREKMEKSEAQNELKLIRIKHSRSALKSAESKKLLKNNYDILPQLSESEIIDGPIPNDFNFLDNEVMTIPSSRRNISSNIVSPVRSPTSYISKSRSIDDRPNSRMRMYTKDSWIEQISTDDRWDSWYDWNQESKITSRDEAVRLYKTCTDIFEQYHSNRQLIKPLTSTNNNLSFDAVNSRLKLFSGAQVSFLKQEWGNLSMISKDLIRQVGVECIPRGQIVYDLVKHYDELVFLFSSYSDLLLLKQTIIPSRDEKSYVEFGTFSNLLHKHSEITFKFEKARGTIGKLNFTLESMIELLWQYKKLAAKVNGYTLADLFLPTHDYIQHQIPIPCINPVLFPDPKEVFDTPLTSSFRWDNKEENCTSVCNIFGCSNVSIFPRIVHDDYIEYLSDWSWLKSNPTWSWVTCLSQMSTGFSDSFSPCGPLGSLLRLKRSKEVTHNFILDADETTFLMVDSTLSTDPDTDASIFQQNMYGFSLRPELSVCCYTSLFPFEDLSISGNHTQSKHLDAENPIDSKNLLAFIKCSTKHGAALLKLILDGLKNGSVKFRCRLSASYPTPIINLRGLFPLNCLKLGLDIDTLQQISKRAKKDAIAICNKFGTIKSFSFSFDGGVRIEYHEVESTVRALLRLHGRSVPSKIFEGYKDMIGLGLKVLAQYSDIFEISMEEEMPISDLTLEELALNDNDMNEDILSEVSPDVTTISTVKTVIKWVEKTLSKPCSSIGIQTEVEEKIILIEPTPHYIAVDPIAEVHPVEEAVAILPEVDTTINDTIINSTQSHEVDDAAFLEESLPIINVPALNESEEIIPASINLQNDTFEIELSETKRLLQELLLEKELITDKLNHQTEELIKIKSFLSQNASESGSDSTLHAAVIELNECHNDISILKDENFNLKIEIASKTAIADDLNNFLEDQKKTFEAEIFLKNEEISKLHEYAIYADGKFERLNNEINILLDKNVLLEKRLEDSLSLSQGINIASIEKISHTEDPNSTKIADTNNPLGDLMPLEDLETFNQIAPEIKSFNPPPRSRLTRQNTMKSPILLRKASFTSIKGGSLMSIRKTSKNLTTSSIDENSSQELDSEKIVEEDSNIDTETTSLHSKSNIHLPRSLGPRVKIHSHIASNTKEMGVQTSLEPQKSKIARFPFEYTDTGDLIKYKFLYKMLRRRIFYYKRLARNALNEDKLGFNKRISGPLLFPDDLKLKTKEWVLKWIENIYRKRLEVLDKNKLKNYFSTVKPDLTDDQLTGTLTRQIKKMFSEACLNDKVLSTELFDAFIFSLNYHADNIRISKFRSFLNQNLSFNELNSFLQSEGSALQDEIDQNISILAKLESSPISNSNIKRHISAKPQVGVRDKATSINIPANATTNIFNNSNIKISNNNTVSIDNTIAKKYEEIKTDIKSNFTKKNSIEDATTPKTIDKNIECISPTFDSGISVSINSSEFDFLTPESNLEDNLAIKLDPNVSPINFKDFMPKNKRITSAPSIRKSLDNPILMQDLGAGREVKQSISRKIKRPDSSADNRKAILSIINIHRPQTVAEPHFSNVVTNNLRKLEPDVLKSMPNLPNVKPLFYQADVINDSRPKTGIQKSTSIINLNSEELTTKISSQTLERNRVLKAFQHVLRPSSSVSELREIRAGYLPLPSTPALLPPHVLIRGFENLENIQQEK